MSSAYVPARLRRLVIKRAEGRCEYCLSPVSHAVSSFAMEHILPLEKGGKTSAGNLALSCQGCNSHKHIKTEAIDPLSNQLARSSIRVASNGKNILGGTATSRWPSD